MLTGPHHLGVLYVPCDGTQHDQLQNISKHQGKTERPFSLILTNKRGTKAPTEHTSREKPASKTAVVSWDQGRDGANAWEGAAPHDCHTIKVHNRQGCEETGDPLRNTPTNHTTPVPRHDLTEHTPPLLCFSPIFCSARKRPGGTGQPRPTGGVTGPGP